MYVNKHRLPTRPEQFGNGSQWPKSGCQTAGHFDGQLEDLIRICEKLILSKGVFHLTIHFSSSQLVCWTFDNPYSYQIYHAEEVFSEHFMRLFAPLDSHLHTCIPRERVRPILRTLKAMREKQQGSELRNASIHMMNGYIALSFDCDDTRYINFRNFRFLEIARS